MRFLQVALLFTFVMLVVVGANAEPQSDGSCVSDADCFQKAVDCYCIGKRLGRPGQCECTGYGWKGSG